MYVVEASGRDGPLHYEFASATEAMLSTFDLRDMGISAFMITCPVGNPLSERQLAMIVVAERTAKRSAR